MSSRNISSSKLFLASLQAQFDAFINRDDAGESPGNQFEDVQNSLDNELDILMGKMHYKPDLSAQQRRSRQMIQKKEHTIPAEGHPVSSNHFTSDVKVPAYLATYKRAPHFDALNALFTVSVAITLALPWLLWPAQYLTPPDEQPVPHLADRAKSVAPTIIADAASDRAAPDKIKALNTVLAINPAGAGSTKSSAGVEITETDAKQDSAVDKLLKIVPPVGRVRDEPGLQGMVVAKLQHGTLVVKLGRQGDWFRIRLPDNREAWAYKTIVASTLLSEK